MKERYFCIRGKDFGRNYWGNTEGAKYSKKLGLIVVENRMVLVWKCIRSGLYSPSFRSVGDVVSVLVC